MSSDNARVLCVSDASAPGYAYTEHDSAPGSVVFDLELRVARAVRPAVASCGSKTPSANKINGYQIIRISVAISFDGSVMIRMTLSW